MSDVETIRLTCARSTASGALWTPEEITVPRQLGRVKLIRMIGRGGMGEVWLGHDELLDRDVAVKFLLNSVSDEHDPAMALFLDGARSAAAIRHPGLTSIYQVDLINGLPYLVMEYVNGPTVAQELTRQGQLSVAQAVAIMHGACEPIAELHNRGIVHRDIKPGNVMLTAAGEVFVTDFGLACSRVPFAMAIDVQGLAGTPAYMAPEMFEGVVSTRSDVYSLGIMLFELLVGHMPFDGDVNAMHGKHASEPIPLDPLQQRGIHKAMVDLIERATHKNPRYRIKTARQFQASLEKASRQAGIRSNGAGEIFALVSSLNSQLSLAGDQPSSPEKSSSYHEQLTTLAVRRKLEATRPVTAVQSDDRRLEERLRGAVVPTTQTRYECPRCGYDQRGIIAQWSQTCPLTGRCSECGLEFAWVDLLRSGKSEPKWCIEFVKGRGRSLRAFLATSWRALLPWRIWSEIGLAHEVKPRRVAVYLALLGAVVIIVSCVWQFAVGAMLFQHERHELLLSISQAERSWSVEYIWPPGYDYASTRPVIKQREITDDIRSTIETRDKMYKSARASLAKLSVGDELLRSLRHPILAYAMLANDDSFQRLTLNAILQWMVVDATFTALLPFTMVLLPISRRRAQVRRQHVARVFAYSMPMALTLVMMCWMLTAQGMVNAQHAILVLRVAQFLPPILMVAWWRQAIARYFRLPHSWAIAILLGIAAWLTITVPWFNLGAAVS